MLLLVLSTVTNWFLTDKLMKGWTWWPLVLFSYIYYVSQKHSEANWSRPEPLVSNVFQKKVDNLLISNRQNFKWFLIRLSGFYLKLIMYFPSNKYSASTFSFFFIIKHLPIFYKSQQPISLKFNLFLKCSLTFLNNYPFSLKHLHFHHFLPWIPKFPIFIQTFYWLKLKFYLGLSAGHNFGLNFRVY